MGGDGCTYQSPPDSLRAELELFPAAAEANEEGAIVVVWLLWKWLSSGRVLSRPEEVVSVVEASRECRRNQDGVKRIAVSYKSGEGGAKEDRGTEAGVAVVLRRQKKSLNRRRTLRLAFRSRDVSRAGISLVQVTSLARRATRQEHVSLLLHFISTPSEHGTISSFYLYLDHCISTSQTRSRSGNIHRIHSRTLRLCETSA